MSLIAITAVRTLPERGVTLDPRDRFVLYALADYADERLLAWPSYATLADWTGYARSTIVASLEELERLGMIASRQRRREDGSYSSKVYDLRFARPGAIPSGGVPGAGTPPSAGRTPPVREADPPRPGAGPGVYREPDPKIPQVDPPSDPPSTPSPDELDEIALELERSVEEGRRAEEIRRAKTHDRAVLGSAHPRVWRALGPIASSKGWKPAQISAVSRRVLELVRDRGEEPVAKLLEEIVLNLAEIRSPIAYLERALAKGAARAADAPEPGPSADLDAIFAAELPS